MKKVFLLFACILSFSFTGYNTVKHELKPLTKENVWNVINELEIKFPEIVFAQAMLESGDLKSDLARNNNNIFGMKVPKKRSTTATSSRRGYAVYSSWVESLKDYKLYQDYILERRSLTTATSYVAFLNKTYAEIGDLYSKRIHRVLSEHKPLIDSYEKDQESIQPN